MSLILADARQIPLRGETVQCVVTSPPYWGLRDYGVEGQIGLEPTPEQYVSTLVEVFREVWRVLRVDGTCWVNLGDSYAGAGYSNHENTGGAQRADGGKPRHLTGSGHKPKDICGIPWRVAFALQADGWYLRSDIIWSKPNPMPESVTDRPTKAHEYVFLLSKSAKYFFDAEAVKECSNTTWNSHASFVAAGPRRKLPPTEELRQMQRTQFSHDTHHPDINQNSRNIRTVWTIPTQPYSGAHFATFPERLVERCVKAGSAAGDLVLDPFCGSGTTVKVAKRLGRKAVGLDISAEYLDLAEHRVASLKPPSEAQPSLFGAA